MRRALLVSLAAVIVAGGLAMVAYSQEGEGRRGPPPGRRPEGEGRRGPPRPPLTEEQRAKLAELMKGPVGQNLRAALEKFRAAVKEIVGDDERAVRMATFRAIMQQMRPPGQEGREGREGRRRPERPRRPPE